MYNSLQLNQILQSIIDNNCISCLQLDIFERRCVWMQLTPFASVTRLKPCLDARGEAPAHFIEMHGKYMESRTFGIEAVGEPLTHGDPQVASLMESLDLQVKGSLLVSSHLDSIKEVSKTLFGELLMSRNNTNL